MSNVSNMLSLIYLESLKSSAFFAPTPEGGTVGTLQFLAFTCFHRTWSIFAPITSKRDVLLIPTVSGEGNCDLGPASASESQLCKDGAMRSLQ